MKMIGKNPLCKLVRTLSRYWLVLTKKIDMRRRILCFYLRFLEYLMISWVRTFTRREIPTNENLIIVSAADTSHYLSLLNFLSSLYKHMPESRVIFFDLGLSDTENRSLKKWFKHIELRRFDYSSYPDYFNIKIKRGCYAFKPVIIADIMNEFKRPVIWMDAGTLVRSRLDRVREVMSATGLYIKQTVSSVRRFVHPGTYKYIWGDVPEIVLDSSQYNASLVGIDYKAKKVRQIINAWREYALIKKCIAPEGSNLRNHRYDQAVLVILIYKFLDDSTREQMELSREERDREFLSRQDIG